MDVPSFQDIDSEELSSPAEDQEQAVIEAADAAFADEEVEFMLHVLREKGLFAFIKLFVEDKGIPIAKLLLPFGIMLPLGIVSPLDQLRILKIACSRVLRNREKLDEYNTVDDAVELIRRSKRILVLTGAGVSTSCGIPDFRSATGLYARLKEENWELEDPQEMFDLTFFKERPDVFYSFAKEIYPSNFIPSPCHRFVRLLELNGQLLRNYTQNIDGLFEQVGVERVLNCHGSFASASCLTCRAQFPGSAIEEDVFAQRVPLCPLCLATEAALPVEEPKPIKPLPEKWKDDDDDNEAEEESDRSIWHGRPIVKPNIVFFGEMLSDEFDRKLLADREEVDLLITIGTSLRVSPVAQIVSHLPHSIPQILINRDPITHANFDIHLLGDGDTIINYLCEKLGGEWDLGKVPIMVPDHANGLPVGAGEEEKKALGEQAEIVGHPKEEVIPQQVAQSCVWLFPGSDPEHRWIKAVRQAFESEDEEEGESLQLQTQAEAGEGAESLLVPLVESGSRSRSRTGSEEGEEEHGKRARVV